jgi:hypothetical protein
VRACVCVCGHAAHMCAGGVRGGRARGRTAAASKARAGCAAAPPRPGRCRRGVARRRRPGGSPPAPTPTGPAPARRRCTPPRATGVSRGEGGGPAHGLDRPRGWRRDGPPSSRNPGPDWPGFWREVGFTCAGRASRRGRRGCGPAAGRTAGGAAALVRLRYYSHVSGASGHVSGTYRVTYHDPAPASVSCRVTYRESRILTFAARAAAAGGVGGGGRVNRVSEPSTRPHCTLRGSVAVRRSVRRRSTVTRTSGARGIPCGGRGAGSRAARLLCHPLRRRPARPRCLRSNWWRGSGGGG